LNTYSLANGRVGLFSFQTTVYKWVKQQTKIEILSLTFSPPQYPWTCNCLPKDWPSCDSRNEICYTS
jgi:hypothetical protein